MAAKSAKDVVLDTLRIEMVDNYNCLSCGHHQPESLVSKALRVVASLDKAGLLAHTHSVSLDFHKAEMAAMTRERDEARAERNAARIQRDVALASAASPEVMRVCDAVLKHKAAYWALYVHKPYDSPEWHELAESANALSASRQPKAQEPRWTTEAMRYDKLGCAVWGVKRGDKWHGPFSADVCHKLADLLTAEAK